MIEKKSRTVHATVDAIYRAELSRAFATSIRPLGDFVRNGKISITEGRG